MAEDTCIRTWLRGAEIDEPAQLKLSRVRLPPASSLTHSAPPKRPARARRVDVNAERLTDTATGRGIRGIDGRAARCYRSPRRHPSGQPVRLRRGRVGSRPQRLRTPSSVDRLARLHMLGVTLRRASKSAPAIRWKKDIASHDFDAAEAFLSIRSNLTKRNVSSGDPSMRRRVSAERVACSGHPGANRLRS